MDANPRTTFFLRRAKRSCAEAPSGISPLAGLDSPTPVDHCFVSSAPSPSFAHSAQAALLEQLARVGRLHADRQANPIVAGALERIARWQARRLRLTYADVAMLSRYAAAIRFFENDLYGNVDFAKRDADLARVVPLMVRMLPEKVIATVAQAVELNALSHELDGALLARLPRPDGTQ